MPKRVRLNSSGLRIAQSGFDVDTATIAQLNFWEGGSVQGVIQSGTLVLDPVGMPVAGGTSTGRYRYKEVLYATPLSYAPQVLACGVDAANSQRDIGPFVRYSGSSFYYIEPNYVIAARADGFEIWASADLFAGYGSNLSTWKYWVLRNGING